jgi:F-box/leucine-rich repeat protein 2/20
MAQRLKHLAILSLNGCNNVGDESIIALAEHCPRIQSLSLFSLRITDTVLTRVTSKCPNLIALSVSGCVGITDAGATTIGGCRSLQSLYLNAAKITDETLVQIALKCTRLRALSVNDCFELSDRGVMALADHCRSLQSLSMNGCQVSVVGLKALLDRCNDLRELSIKECVKCVLDGPQAHLVVYGTGGMHALTASGDEVLQRLGKKKLALLR